MIWHIYRGRCLCEQPFFDLFIMSESSTVQPIPDNLLPDPSLRRVAGLAHTPGIVSVACGPRRYRCFRSFPLTYRGPSPNRRTNPGCFVVCRAACFAIGLTLPTPQVSLICRANHLGDFVFGVFTPYTMASNSIVQPIPDGSRSDRATSRCQSHPPHIRGPQIWRAYRVDGMFFDTL